MNPGRLRQAVLVAVVLFTTSAFAEDYRIQFSRPMKAGDRYWLVATEKKNRSVEIIRDGNVVQRSDESTTVTLKAIVEILKVDRHGGPLRKTVTIERFVDDQGTKLLNEGDVVLAETMNGKTVYRLDEKDLPARAEEHLADLIKTKSGTKISDDALFGSKEKRRVGESWTVNSQLAAKQFGLKPNAVTGKVTFVGMEKFAGMQCLKTVTDLRLRKTPKAERLTKQGFRVKVGEVRMQFTDLLPINPDEFSPKTAMQATVKATFIGTAAAVKGLIADIRTEIQVEKRVTLHE